MVLTKQSTRIPNYNSSFIIRKSNEIGSLKEGSFANFLITSGEILIKKP
jgi:predicted amidohydrolase YtcJ